MLCNDMGILSTFVGICVKADLLLAIYESMGGQIVDFVLFEGVAVLMNWSYTGVEYVHRIPMIVPLELALLLLLPTTILMIL
jgi:hypothetical protein